MHISFNIKFNKKVISIHPGEFYSTKEDEVISTILGSCIAVVLFDKEKMISGMNHFMLPSSNIKNADANSAKYGVNAMELLINDILKKGGLKKNFTAKVFGGGHVLNSNVQSIVPKKNIDFTLEFLKNEGISIEAKDIGGENGRKLLLFTQSRRTFVSIIKSSEEALKDEEKYAKKFKEQKLFGNQEGKIVLF